MCEAEKRESPAIPFTVRCLDRNQGRCPNEECLPVSLLRRFDCLLGCDRSNFPNNFWSVCPWNCRNSLHRCRRFLRSDENSLYKSGPFNKMAHMFQRDALSVVFSHRRGNSAQFVSGMVIANSDISNAPLGAARREPVFFTRSYPGADACCQNLVSCSYHFFVFRWFSGRAGRLITQESIVVKELFQQPWIKWKLIK